MCASVWDNSVSESGAGLDCTIPWMGGLLQNCLPESERSLKTKTKPVLLEETLHVAEA